MSFTFLIYIHISGKLGNRRIYKMIQRCNDKLTDILEKCLINKWWTEYSKLTSAMGICSARPPAYTSDHTNCGSARSCIFVYCRGGNGQGHQIYDSYSILVVPQASDHTCTTWWTFYTSAKSQVVQLRYKNTWILCVSTHQSSWSPKLLKRCPWMADYMRKVMMKAETTHQAMNLRSKWYLRRWATRKHKCYLWWLTQVAGHTKCPMYLLGWW